MYTDIDILYNDEERILRAQEFIDDYYHLPAKRLLEEVLENDALNEKAHYLLGGLYEFRFYEMEKALEHYRIAIRINANYDAAYHLYVKALITANQPKTAIHFALKRCEIASHCQDAILYDLSRAYEMDGQLSEAQEIIDRLMSNAINDAFISDLESAKERIESKRNVINDRDSKLTVTYGLSDIQIA